MYRTQKKKNLKEKRKTENLPTFKEQQQLDRKTICGCDCNSGKKKKKDQNKSWLKPGRPPLPGEVKSKRG